MPNFPGQIGYTLLANGTPLLDSGLITKNTQTGLARGGTSADFNVQLRGIAQRTDRLPKRPYP